MVRKTYTPEQIINKLREAEALADFRKFISLTNNPQWIEMAKQQIEELSE